MGPEDGEEVCAAPEGICRNSRFATPAEASWLLIGGRGRELAQFGELRTCPRKCAQSFLLVRN